MTTSNIVHSVMYPGTTSEVEQSLFIDAVHPLYNWFDPSAARNEAWNRFFGDSDNVIDVLREGSEIVGFSITRSFKSVYGSVQFRGGTLIAPEYHSHGLYRQLIEIALKRDSPRFIVTRTQNPRVYETLSYYSKSRENIFPNPFVITPGHVVEVAKITENLNNIPNDLRVFGVYRGLRSDAHFKSTLLPWISQYFAEKLDENDAFIVVVVL